jgi:hypothetical protein
LHVGFDFAQFVVEVVHNFGEVVFLDLEGVVVEDVLNLLKFAFPLGGVELRQHKSFLFMEVLFEAIDVCAEIGVVALRVFTFVLDRVSVEVALDAFEADLDWLSFDHFAKDYYKF